jgi:hypothetical protein
MNPTGKEVYVDPVLTNISVKYQNPAYIAGEVMPVVEVEKDSGYYYKYDKSSFRTANDDRAPGTRANKVNYGLTKVAYGPLTEHSLETDITKEDMDAADTVLDAEQDATEMVTDVLLLNREKGLADYMANTSNITQNVTLSSTDQWSDYDGSDPIGVIKTARQTVASGSGMLPNTLVLSEQVYMTLQQHPDLLERFKYSERGLLTTEHMKALFEVDKVLVARARVNSAKEGQTDSMAYVWGKHAWLLYIAPVIRPRIVTFGVHLAKKPTAGGVKTEKWFEIGTNTTYVRTSMYYKRWPVATECAYLIKNAIA